MAQHRTPSEDSDKTAVETPLKLGTPHPIRVLKMIFNIPTLVINAIFGAFYLTLQRIIVFMFAPPAPKESTFHGGRQPFGRIAVIGAGLTGVSSAAHAIAHGFEVVIFEKKDKTGGVWADVNKTSGLQLNSMLYRFHPSIIWSCGFPKQTEILSNIESIWRTYGLESRTRFNYTVDEVKRHPTSTSPSEGGHGRWVINDGAEGIFDAVIVAVGTCGEPKSVDFKGVDTFKGTVVHSSKLDGVNLEGKRVISLGSGASGVEAVELGVAKGAKETTLLARHDKWIIPRNIIISTLLALQPFGRETVFSAIPEWLLKKLHYRDLAWMAPTHKGLYAGTPIVNERMLQDVRDGTVKYLRGDILEIVPEGVKFNLREDPKSRPGDRGQVLILKADVLVEATGFTRPSIDFLPKDLFPEGAAGQNYSPPNLYLQTFSTVDWSILLTNAAYQDALGTVGHVHIGIYTRILLTFLLDKSATPSPSHCQLWVDVLRYIKESAPGGALGFFTYMELTVWLVAFHLFRLDRLRWIFFNLFGWGVNWNSPLSIADSYDTKGKKAM